MISTPDGWVYVIGSPDSRPVKIGRAVNPEKRMAAIQLMSPVPLTVLWRTPGGHDLETALHVRFDAQWIHGEWFDFGEQVSEFAIEESFLKPEFRPVELPVTTAEIIRLARESLNEP